MNKTSIIQNKKAVLNQMTAFFVKTLGGIAGTIKLASYTPLNL